MTETVAPIDRTVLAHAITQSIVHAIRTAMLAFKANVGAGLDAELATLFGGRGTGGLGGVCSAAHWSGICRC